MHRAGGITQGSLSVFSSFLNGIDGCSQIAGIVECVKNSEDVHAVLGRTLDESSHHIVREAGVLNDVLPPQEHHVRSPGAPFLERIQAVKGVFIQEAQAGINGGSSPRFQGAKAHLIQAFEGWKHLAGPHSGGRQRLMTVAQNGVVEYNGTGRRHQAKLAECLFGIQAESGRTRTRKAYSMPASHSLALMNSPDRL